MEHTPEQLRFTSLAAAARATGKSRTTIQRAIKSGKLSAPKDDDGNYSIDPSELHRVFPLLKGAAPETHAVHAHGTLQNSSETAAEQPEIKVLRVELEAAQRMIEERGKTIEDLRTRLDKTDERYEAAQTKLTAILTDQRETHPQQLVPQPSPPKTRAGYWIALGMVIAVLAGAGGLLVFAPELLLGAFRSTEF